jgi:Domain of unknown function (DUF397)
MQTSGSDSHWVKSSFSYSNGNCVEVAFRKSRHSMSNGHCAEVAFLRSSRCQSGECVEAAASPFGVMVRDSKNPGPVLTFTPSEWLAFLAGVHKGEFDHFGR